MNDDSAPKIGDAVSRWEPPPELLGERVPAFVPHRWIRGGHLQTILSLRPPRQRPLRPRLHWVPLDDGDVLALHDDAPPQWRPGDRSLVLVHGLCGCSQSPYMIRLTHRFLRLGVRVFRLEMRGCGVGRDRCVGITHAGRSGDCLAALGQVAALTQQGPIAAVGVSLGGNQMLLAAGRIGAGLDAAPAWLERWDRLVAVSPPIDLARCSDNMQRPLLRGYNRYFIRHLMRRLPLRIRQSPELMRHCGKPWPRTLRQLDERITAPLSGFAGADDYYTRSSAIGVIDAINIPTLILTAQDDPIVPADCFTALAQRAAAHRPLRLLIAPGGGHVGFLARGKDPFWMDTVIEQWCAERKAPAPH